MNQIFKNEILMEKDDLIDLDIDKDSKVIPFNEVARLLRTIKLHKGICPTYIATAWLCCTGARPAELENRKLDEVIMGKYWTWPPAKKQIGNRIEKLPQWFWNDFAVYLDTCPIQRNNVFGMSGESLASVINHHIRPLLGGDWIKKRPSFVRKGGYRLEYIYRLKNLRHNFQTIEWYREKQTYGNDLALERVSRKMRHSTKGMTAHHYIERVEDLKLQNYKDMGVGDILKDTNQLSLSCFDTMTPEQHKQIIREDKLAKRYKRETQHQVNKYHRNAEYREQIKEKNRNFMRKMAAEQREFKEQETRRVLAEAGYPNLQV